MAASGAATKPVVIGARLFETASVRSIGHRGKVGADGLVVESYRHQVHLVHEAQIVLQAPEKHLAISRRQQEAAAGERRRSADERHQSLVRLRHGMSEEGYIRGVTRDLSEVLYDASGPDLNCTLVHRHGRVHAPSCKPHCRMVDRSCVLDAPRNLGTLPRAGRR